MNQMSRSPGQRPYSDGGTPSGPNPRVRLVPHAVIGGFACLVLLPIFAVGVWPSEKIRWYQAAAEDAELNRQFDKALGIYDELLANRSGDDTALKLKRVSLLIDAGETEEAIAEAEALVANHPQALKPIRKLEDVSEALMHLRLLSSAYQQAGEFKRAVEVHEEYAKIAKEAIGEEFERPSFINELAYVRALADVKIAPSLRSMKTLIEVGWDEATILHMSAYQHYLLLKQGKPFFEGNPDHREVVFRKSIHDFDLAIEAYQKRLLEEETTLQKKKDLGNKRLDKVGESEPASTLPAESDELESQDGSSQRDSKKRSHEDEGGGDEAVSEDEILTTRKRELAIAVTHRSLLFSLVGDEENAEADREYVREIGFSSRELSKQVFDERLSFSKLGRFHAWLDTYGYLLYRAERFENAEHKIQTSIQIADAVVSFHHRQIIWRAKQSPDVREVQNQKRQAERSLAVSLYHLWLIEKAQLDEEAAAATLERLQQLGFEASPSLN